MNSSFAGAILITWKRNRNYTVNLVSDVAPEQMVAQPVSGVTMNHAAWIISHLNVYMPIMVALLQRRPFEDPMEHRYGQKSKVVNDLKEYPPKGELLAEYSRLHDDAQRALEDADGRIFGEENPLLRWKSMHPTVGDQLVTLMVKHESMHLGQLSAWRRAMGLAPVGLG